jgi:transposase
MQGVHAFDPKAKTTIDLESWVATDHPLRRVNDVLDLSFVRELTARCYAAGQGRPSIDPEVFFRIVLLGYLRGITKDRRLCEEIRDNLAYRWFCRLPLDEDVPDHSSFSRIRDRYGEEIFERVFRQIVALCRTKGLVKDECRVMTDATLIDADAGLESLVHNDPQQAKEEAQARRPRGMVDRSTRHQLTNQTHTSRTDPDATLCQKRGSPRHLKYKVHQSMDADSRVILDTKVTTGARHDSQPYVDQLQRISDRCGIKIREAIADRGYGSAAIIGTLQKKGMKTSIPLWTGGSGRNAAASAELVYDRENDRIRCPAGKYLYPSPGRYANRKRYVSPAAVCRDCPQAVTCPAMTRKASPHQHYVYRSLDQELFDQVQAQMTEPEFRTTVAERMWKCEGLFAEGKQQHGLARAKYRGRPKVQIQAYLTAMAQNIKRLVLLLYHWLLARLLVSPETKICAHENPLTLRLFQQPRRF